MTDSGERHSLGFTIIVALVVLLFLGIAWKITKAAATLILDGVYVAVLLGILYLVYRMFRRK